MKRFFSVLFSLIATILITASVAAYIMLPVFQGFSERSVIEAAAEESVQATEEKAGVELTDEQRDAANEAAINLITKVTDSFDGDTISLSNFLGTSDVQFFDSILGTPIQLVLAILIFISIVILMLARRSFYEWLMWAGSGALIAGAGSAILASFISTGAFEKQESVFAFLATASSAQTISSLQQSCVIVVCAGACCLVLFLIIFSIFGRNRS